MLTAPVGRGIGVVQTNGTASIGDHARRLRYTARVGAVRSSESSAECGVPGAGPQAAGDCEDLQLAHLASGLQGGFDMEVQLKPQAPLTGAAGGSNVQKS